VMVLVLPHAFLCVTKFLRTTATSRHRHGESYAVRANPILGGLHHDYFLAPSCA